MLKVIKTHRGRGVASTSRILKGSIIELCPIVLFEVPEGKRHILEGYAFRWNDSKVALALGYGSLYNHSFEPNAWVHRRSRELLVEIIALENISRNKEILIDYTGDNKHGEVWFKVK